MVNVYGDESADETKERVFAVAGIVGPEEGWNALQEKWNERCAGIPFHANACDSNQGDFARFSDPENKARYKDLTNLLANSGLGGYGIALDLIASRQVFPETLADMHYYKCFMELLERMGNFATNNGEVVKFIFDRRPEGAYNSGVLYSIAHRFTNQKQVLYPEISFACARDDSRIQIADLFAREVMKHLDNQIGPKKRDPRKSWLCLNGTGRFHMDIYTREWFLDLKQKLPQLELATGMSMEDYAEWLKSTKRNIDNISNRYAYMKYVIERDVE